MNYYQIAKGEQRSAVKEWADTFNKLTRSIDPRKGNNMNDTITLPAGGDFVAVPTEKLTDAQLEQILAGKDVAYIVTDEDKAGTPATEAEGKPTLQ